MKRNNIKKLVYPILAIAGASILLVIILSVLSIQNYNRENDLIIKQLKGEGSTLIRILESAIKNEMMNNQWDQTQIQTLFSEAAKAPNIDCIVFADSTGLNPVNNRLKHFINTMPDLKLSQKESMVVSHIGKNPEDQNVFYVLKPVIPFLSERKTIYNNSLPEQYIERWNNYVSGKYIIVGLKMDELKAAQKEDVRRAIISAIILLILGSASLFFLFILQNYYLINNTLKSLETYTANVVNSMPNGLISLDSKGRITTLNQNGANLLGLTFSDVKGKHLDQVMKECDLKKTILPTSDIIEQQMECQINDGSVIPISTTSSLLKDENDDVIGKVIILRDLRDIKNLEKKIERSERLASLGRMAAGIAHEIRNPLSSIKGFAQYFQRKFRQGSQDANYALVMVNEVDRLNRVIQDLLNFAKPQEAKFKSVDIIAIMEHTLKLMESDLREKKIHVVKNYDQAIPQISADADMITQSLLNIYINAIEAMDENDTMVLDVHLENEGINIFIEDSGKGISKADLLKIFDPFFTLKSGGTGLGLAIVYRIVENHHGEIEVKSEPGKGASFRIYLPVKQI